MRIFETRGKTNFVDDNNVLVGFDSEQSCCEDFGYQLSEYEPSSFHEGNNGINPDGYQFDTEFFKEVTYMDTEDGGAVLFKLVKGDDSIFLTLRNAHNGYYSHGFEMLKNEIKIREGWI